MFRELFSYLIGEETESLYEIISILFFKLGIPLFIFPGIILFYTMKFKKEPITLLKSYLMQLVMLPFFLGIYLFPNNIYLYFISTDILGLIIFFGLSIVLLKLLVNKPDFNYSKSLEYYSIYFVLKSLLFLIIVTLFFLQTNILS